MLKFVAIVLASANAVSLEKMDPSTGAPIAICNGLNAGKCVTAEEVNTKAVRRPFKRAAKGDPDYEAQEKADAAKSLVQQNDPKFGAPIAICNGANEGKCVTAEEVTTKHVRRPFKRAAPGDPDFEAQEKADAARSLAQKDEVKKLPTCDKFTTTNCQPVCSETLTVGCTEARTPNQPDVFRYSGIGNYDYNKGTVQGLAAKK